MTSRATVSQTLTGLDSFPIMGWCSIPEHLGTEETFRTIAACGINLIMTVGAGSGARGPDGKREAIFRQLDLAAGCGLRAIICDARFSPPVRPSDEAWKHEADAALADYRDHPATAGFYIFDEPAFDECGTSARASVPDVALMVRHLVAQAPERLAYVNGLGFGGRGRDCFADYLDGYLDTIRPQFLSVDCYPLSSCPPEDVWPGYHEDDCGLPVPEWNAYYRDCFWEGWETQRLAAHARRLPLWGFAMATPHSHSRWQYGPVTEGTLRVEAFTALAYGAEALQYFTLPTPEHVLYDHGIIDPEGHPSVRYELFRKVNADLAALGQPLAGARSRAVYFTHQPPSGCRRFRKGRWAGDSSHRPLAGTGGDPVMLSFLAGSEGENLLLVLNHNPAGRSRTRLDLDAGWNVREYSRRTGTWAPVQGQSWVAAFEPGDAKLYRLDPPAAGKEGQGAEA